MKTVTATRAAREFSEILNRVHYKGESFSVTRNGEEVAQIVPPKKKFTLGDLKKLMAENPWDEDFANDLEQIHREQGATPEDPWKS